MSASKVRGLVETALAFVLLIVAIGAAAVLVVSAIFWTAYR